MKMHLHIARIQEQNRKKQQNQNKKINLGQNHKQSHIIQFIILALPNLVFLHQFKQNIEII